MSSESISSPLSRHRIIPVIVIEDAAAALPLADALLEGGLPIAEITLRTPAALDAIRQIAQHRPQVLVGAGTVLTVPDLEAAKAAGATFAVAPGLNPAVVARAREINLSFIPGVATPTEIEAALALRCDVLKFFPAEALGGTRMLAAISAPYKHTGIRFVPTGGINLSNMPGYLKLNTVCAVGGAWIADQESIAAGQWSAIRDRCKAALEGSAPP